mmetsp:Transcript_11767/g.35286  ORF Transcript_11767/g.35286 Transcript_11767/m.35286 type:complete len:270 (+) Transcript_11767:109-918(+)
MSWPCLPGIVRRCCSQLDDEPIDPPAPTFRRQRDVSPGGLTCLSHPTHAPEVLGSPFEQLDMPILELVLSKLPMEELLVSARGVCQEWRSTAEAVAIHQFQEQWCLDSVTGRPRALGSLLKLGRDSFVTRRSCGSVESISALAVAANVPTAQLKRTNSLMSEHSLHSRDHIFVPVGDVTGLRGEFYFCPVIGRQFVLFEREGVVGVYLDPAAKQAAEAATFAKLALLLSKGLRVDLGMATFYLQNARGDMRQAVTLHQQDVAWDRARRR